VEETQTNSTSHKMTWLVLGAKGQLGQELIHLLKIKQIEATGTDRNEIDFAKPNEIAEKLTKLNPSHIVNCGAYTQVDKAEEEPELANLINAQAVGVIAKFASERKIPFVHISTDYVFDGTSTIAYLEADKVNPQSVYGSSKALGEKEALENNPESYILRTAPPLVIYVMLYVMKKLGFYCCPPSSPDVNSKIWTLATDSRNPTQPTFRFRI
jgi:dTDP-4-dehydrorhamnose reductase